MRRYTDIKQKMPVKESTGLTGLDVQPHGREILIKLYEKILFELEKQIEPDSPYRQHTEKYVKERLQICREEEDIFRIEERIDEVQIEELILLAEQQLPLIPLMAEEKPWVKEKWHTVPMIYTKFG